MPIGRSRLGVVIAVLGFVAALGIPGAAAAGSDSKLLVEATIDGHSLKDAGANSPIALHPTDSTVIRVVVNNSGTNPVEVRAVRLDARVLGLAFFSYTTRVDLTVAPGATGTRTFDLDLADLDGQATGLLPAELSLLAPDRTVLTSEKGTVDVKGSLGSVYGVFGLAVAAITALLLLSLIGRLIRRKLPDNRWQRALRFAVPGLGLGLTVTFTLGVLRVVVPSLATSIGFLIGGLVVGFVLGYLTPSPGDEADRDELDERDVLAAPPVVPAVRVQPPSPPAPYTPPPVPSAPAYPAATESRATAPGLQTPAPPAEPIRPTAPPAPPSDDDPRQTRLSGPPTPPPA
jgi:hypothetical protein